MMNWKVLIWKNWDLGTWKSEFCEHIMNALNAVSLDYVSSWLFENKT